MSLLSSLNNIGDDKEAGEELEGIVEFIMSQLVSKQVLYEPLKEIHEKVCKFANSVPYRTLIMQTVPWLSR